MIWWTCQHYSIVKHYKHYNAGLISCIAHVLIIGGGEPSGGFSVTPWFRLYTRSRMKNTEESKW